MCNEVVAPLSPKGRTLWIYDQDSCIFLKEAKEEASQKSTENQKEKLLQRRSKPRKLRGTKYARVKAKGSLLKVIARYIFCYLSFLFPFPVLMCSTHGSRTRSFQFRPSRNRNGLPRSETGPRVNLSRCFAWLGAESASTRVTRPSRPESSKTMQ